MHHNRTLSWNEFVAAVALVHEKRMGQPTHRRVIVDKPKEEDYFDANPQERLCEGTNCDLLGHGNSSKMLFHMVNIYIKYTKLFNLVKCYFGF